MSLIGGHATSDVHDVAGARPPVGRRRPAGPLGSISIARPVSDLAAGQRTRTSRPTVDAGRGVRRAAGAAVAGLAARLPGVVRVPQRVEQAPPSSSVRSGAVADHRQRGRLGHRQLVRGHADVEPDPDDRRRAVGVSTRSTRIPATLRSPTARRWATSPRRRTRPPAAPARPRSPVSSGSHGHGRGRRPSAAAAPRRSAPSAPASPRSGRAGRGRRSGARRRHQPLRRAGPGPLGDQRVGRGGLLDHLHLTAGQPARRAARGRGRARVGWASRALHWPTVTTSQ